MEKTTANTIWKKLLDIQKEFKTFDVHEDSEKVDSKGRAVYRYTPGWEIVEKIREKMDNASLMLVQNVTSSSSQPIEYPVYKLINGAPMSFIKKEIYVQLTVEFTWIDAETCEQAGPFSITSSGANGTDKSMASALALAERYFLLKFFRITTREKSDEPDAHDADNIPGIPKENQATPANPYQPYQQPARAKGRQQPQGGYQMKGTFQATAEMPNNGMPGMNPPAYQPHPYEPAQPAVAFDTKNPHIGAAIDRLAMFDKGTPTHQQVLNEIIGDLSQKGISCFTQNFLSNLTESAQAKREHRMPRLQ